MTFVERWLYSPLHYFLHVKNIRVESQSDFYEYKFVFHTLVIGIYLTNPCSPWVRGLKEYFYGLLRKYIKTEVGARGVMDTLLNAIGITLANNPNSPLLKATICVIEEI